MALFKKKKKEQQVENAAPSKNVEHKKQLSGITRRWVLNTLIVIIIALLIFSVMILFFLQNYYYSTVDVKLSSQYSSSVASFFSSYTGSTSERFEAGAREFVENFSQKDIMEVWVIDENGKVVVSSSGFEIPDQDIPDYKEALKSESRSASYTGNNGYGENIKSETFLLPSVNGKEVGAIRYIISLDSINYQLAMFFILILIVFAIIVILITLSGFFFIQSIVRPVNEINEIAKRIAQGDLTARAPPREHNDEIGELCESINYMAEEISSSDKMKNDFVSTVSHEMKTPLTAIKGWGETILDVCETDPALTKRGIEVIINESARLTGIVEDLLDLSRIVNGRLTLRTTRIDILAELDETIFVFKDRSMREGIELIYNAPHNPTPADGDPDRIKQVFVNVLDNAFKYTEQGGKISVLARVIPLEEDDTKANLKIYVEDTGCGISEEELPKVKKKFYKSNISVRGSGIGLAVCDEIVNMHGGTLEIESELGVGTCITITLPVDYVELQDDLPIPEDVIKQSETLEMRSEEENGTA